MRRLDKNLKVNLLALSDLSVQNLINNLRKYII